MSINVLAELERNGISYEFANSDEISVACPFHEDSSPSCHVNVAKELFICRASQCGQKGDIVALLARFLKTSRKVVIEDLGTRYVMNNEPTIDVGIVEKYHARIWKAKILIKELYKRAVTDEDIRTYRLGEHQGRITIPVKNSAGQFVNIRSYLPGAPGADKMRNLRGRGKRLRLYPIEQLAYSKLIVCGGEMKAICVARELNKHGYGAVCVTSGEGNWHGSLTQEFQGKETWTLMDIDEAGRKASEAVNRHLNRVAVSTHTVELPLDSELFPKGDVNDFVYTGGNLLKVVQEAPAWSPRKARTLANSEPKVVTLSAASHASLVGERIKVVGTVTTMDTSPYAIPKEIRVRCSKDQKECALCQVFVEPDEDFVYKIQSESSALLEMIDQKKQAQQQAIQEELEIPPTCRVCRFEAVSCYNIEDARISPQLLISDRSNEKALQPAMCIGDGLELNETYEFIGRMHPHPATQQATLMISSYTPTQDALSNYKCDKERLELFQPKSWTLEGVTAKLDHIYEDLEANVTRIYRRRWIHLFCDLAYHSPLFIPFDGKRNKGWVEVLIIGDSSQGKSETAMNLQQHYNLGEKVECKNATVAGLLGGLQQFGSRWFVTWGLFPTHDRRLVILEELKGASTEVIAKLTDMRSSGIAEIPKIEKRRTQARTRMIALSNPRSSMSIDQYFSGVQAIAELIGAPEDIRRFDACLVLSKRDVQANELSDLQIKGKSCQHVYTADRCRELILWAWTNDNVVFEDEATSLILKEAVAFCEKFSEVVPIVDRGSMRYKLARLSAALAARTFSISSTEAILVRACHVEYIAKTLYAVYTQECFGYDTFSEAQDRQSELIDVEVVKKQLNDTPFPADVVKSLLYTDYIELTDICDWCAWDRTTAQHLLSTLVRKQALVRKRHAYRKTSAFIELLKNIEPVERPSFVTEEF